MENHVVTVQVDATVGGHRLGVQEATIGLGVNAIPSVTLVCAPTEGQLTPLKPNVEATQIEDYLELYRDLQKKAEGLSESGNVSILIDDSLLGPETIELEGWIICEVGLSGFGATTAPSLSVVLKHPICKLTKIGSIYETPRTLMDKNWNAIASSGSDPIQLCSLVYDFASGKGVQYWPDMSGGLATLFRTDLGKLEFKPEKYLDWGNGQGIMFAVDDGTSMRPRLSQAIARLMLPSDSGTCTWDMLLSLCGQLLTSIIQEDGHCYLDEKLLMESTKPWKSPTVTLEDTWCHGVVMPNADPFRIAGVMARKLGPYAQTVQFGLMRMANMNPLPPTTECFYRPSVEVPEKADGRIMKVEVPRILDSAFRRDAPSDSTIITGLTVMSMATRINNYNNLVKRYCKAMYEISACSMVHATAHMALRAKDLDYHLILPGQSCVFKAGGKDIFYGYIRNVMIHASVNGGCETAVMMSHVRQEPDYKVDDQTAIPVDSPNAAYD